MDDDLFVYEPYHVRNTTEGSQFKFLKAANHFFNRPISDADEAMESGNSPQLQLRPLRALEDVCGYRTVFMPGTTPCFIIKSATSRPHVLGLRGKAVHNLTAFHTRSCERGFSYVDTEVSRFVISRSSNPSLTMCCRILSACAGSLQIPDLTICGPRARSSLARRWTALNTPRLPRHTFLGRVKWSILNSLMTMKSTLNGRTKVW